MTIETKVTDSIALDDSLPACPLPPSHHPPPPSRYVQWNMGSAGYLQLTLPLELID